MRSNRKTALINTAIAVVILVISFTTVMLVGIGDAYKNHPQFLVDRVVAQGQIMQNSLQTYLNAGLPLEQFSGFASLSQSILDTDLDIQQVQVVNVNGQETFNLNRQGFSRNDTNYIPTPSIGKQDIYMLEENKTDYRVKLPLKNKFEQVGDILVTLTKQAVTDDINESFRFVWVVGVALIAVFFALAIRIYLSIGQYNAKWLDFSFSFTYLILAAAVMLALTFLYSGGIQGKTQGLMLSLGSRLNAPIQLNLDFEDLTGITETLESYQDFNPEISYIAVRSSNQTLYEAGARGEESQQVGGFFEYEVALPSQNPETPEYGMVVKTPKDILYRRLWRSVKNFLSLFIASAFLSTMFLNLLKLFTRKPDVNTIEYEVFQMKLIEPYYFILSFVDGLSISFLPQYLNGIADASQVDIHLVPTLFTTYFLGWALAMLPATSWVNRYGCKPVLLWSGLLTGLVALAMAGVQNFWAMYLIRALAGAGQGILTVAVQSYILEVVSPQRKTQGNDLMVFDFFAARLSSVAIGALLSIYLGIQGVFLVGAVVGLSALIYLQGLIPQILPGAATTQTVTDLNQQDGAVSSIPQNTSSLLQSLTSVFRDLKFIKTIFLIGLPYRAVFTGVTVFALPLLLSRQQFGQEDIGQIMMFYAAGVLLSSAATSRYVDRIGNIRFVLVFGCVASGIGLFLMGLVSASTIWQENFPILTVILLACGVSLLGIGHGSINAPSLTYITETDVAKRLGQATTGSIYRLLERAGQIMGPILIGQLLFFYREDFIALSWVGLASIVFGILFWSEFRKGSQKSESPS
ncbi:MAG: MFS transporter [Cyanobacteriota bacterium]|nr:MFS transporter [Cyanobacteriota bacterium]